MALKVARHEKSCVMFYVTSHLKLLNNIVSNVLSNVRKTLKYIGTLQVTVYFVNFEKLCTIKEYAIIGNKIFGKTNFQVLN